MLSPSLAPAERIRSVSWATLLHEGALFAMIGLLAAHHAGLASLSPAVGVTLSAAALIVALVFTNRRKTLEATHQALTARHSSLHHEASRDPLTGLNNRVAFASALDLETDGSRRGEFAVLFFDLDRFKEVNDSLGHKFGDLVLIQVARRLTRVLAEARILARVGGDEFAAILPVSPARPPEDYARAVIEALCEPFRIEDHMVQIGTSVGIAVGDRETAGGDDLLREADLAMYEAKSRQDCSYRRFDSELEEKLLAKTGIRAEIAGAIEDNLLALNYQPIVDARTGALISAEALLRWKSERLGEISPSVLIPIVEESGQIVELGNWTLDTAIAAVKRLGDVALGVNISPAHFRHHGFANAVGDRLLAAGVQPRNLTIEITEGVLISHMADAKRTIGQLRNLGVKVYLDDFGTGYSSLSYLQNFELDGMKIDKSFLRNIGQRNQATQIIRSVIDLGHSLGLKVVAEGVENDWQARLLQLLNCDLLQGFYLATPMALDELAAFKTEGPASAKLAAQPLDAAVLDVANHRSASRSGPTATTAKPPARAASIPAGASSITRQSRGASPSASPAQRKMSGAGLGRSTVVASAITSNRCATSSRVSTRRAFALDEASAVAKPRPRASSSNATTPGSASSGPIRSSSSRKYACLRASQSTRSRSERRRPPSSTSSESPRVRPSMSP